ncbi:hypothetical protein MtrunA17_Chr8g0354871 [Medicago truncatula]|uniref:DUF247 domain protein n=1 Tax=Medicago truncatula TaxID=3880 RepID=A0A396GJT2_MEDTR|nr:hypothetical protein MtrunA17_Chr8g0354871 [Medicago truncatula]
MMILDGCFILEIVRRPSPNNYNNLLPYILRDMLILENQIPMTVLHTLLQVEKGDKVIILMVFSLKLFFFIKKKKKKKNTLKKFDYTHIYLKFKPNTKIALIHVNISKTLVFSSYIIIINCNNYIPKFCHETLQGYNQLSLYSDFKFLLGLDILRPSYSMGEFMHVLDMFRKYVIPPPTEVEEMLPNALVVTAYSNISVSYRSAVELDDAGISFQKSETSNFGDVSFKRGVLRLPFMVLDENTPYIFHNLTAFESLHIEVGKEVTMFLLFMSSIINSAKDVSILCQSGILINAYGSYEDIAKLFNSLPKEIPIDESLGFGGMLKVNDFSKMRSEIDEFCKKPWNKWRANLTHTYFRNPWSMVSLVAAIFLFALTSIQTGYSIAQFYQKPN